MDTEADRRTVRMSIEHMETPHTGAQTHPWEGRAWVGDERVVNVRCSQRSIAIDSCLGGIALAGVEFEEETNEGMDVILKLTRWRAEYILDAINVFDPSDQHEEHVIIARDLNRQLEPTGPKPVHKQTPEEFRDRVKEIEEHDSVANALQRSRETESGSA